MANEMKYLFEIISTVAALAAVFYLVFGLFPVAFAVIEFIWSIYVSVFYYLNFCK